MFTGLVEGQGTIRSIRADGAAVRLDVTVPHLLTGGGHIGDSIAINGCCLTIVELGELCWTFEAGSETLSRTNLQSLRNGDAVNLERSLPVNGRLGGHFVQGHIDGVGTVDRIDREGEWVFFWVRLPEELAAQLVPKGSVAVDGVSLTVVDAERDRCSVALIPHTLEVTTLGKRRLNDLVNIETDILGKYVRRFLGGLQSGES